MTILLDPHRPAEDQGQFVRLGVGPPDELRRAFRPQAGKRHLRQLNPPEVERTHAPHEVGREIAGDAGRGDPLPDELPPPVETLVARQQQRVELYECHRIPHPSGT